MEIKRREQRREQVDRKEVSKAVQAKRVRSLSSNRLRVRLTNRKSQIVRMASTANRS